VGGLTTKPTVATRLFKARLAQQESFWFTPRGRWCDSIIGYLLGTPNAVRVSASCWLASVPGTCRYRLVVRTLRSQRSSRGSTPRSGTKGPWRNKSAHLAYIQEAVGASPTGPTKPVTLDA
jgi:hypothetical protein